MSTFWARCLAKVSGRMTAGVGNRLMRGRSVSVGAAARPGGGPGPPPAVPGSAPCSGAEALAGCQVPRALPPQVDVGGAGADPYPWPAPPPLIWPPASSWVSRVSCRWPPCPCCNAAGQGGAEEAVTPTRGVGNPASCPLPVGGGQLWTVWAGADEEGRGLLLTGCVGLVSMGTGKDVTRGRKGGWGGLQIGVNLEVPGVS